MKKRIKKAKSKPRPKAKVIAKSSGMGVQPLGDRVLIKPIIDTAEKTKSGIYIPETVAKDKSDQGKVIAVGEGKYVDGKLISIRMKIGDVVMFSKYAYEEVKINGEEYLILKEENILAIIK